MATNEEKTINEQVKETKTTTTKQSQKENELEKQIATMAEIIKNLQEQINSVNRVNTTQPNIVVTAPNTDVDLVYLSDSLGVVTVNNLTLNCTRYGEKFRITRTDFDAIVGKYRNWFDRGILAISADNIDVAAAKGIKTDKEYSVTAEKLSKMGKMTTKALEDLWESTISDSEKLSIVTYFKRKFIENDDEGFRDREKIDLMNRLTNGGFEREAVELSKYSDTRYKPIEIDWDR